MIAESSEIKFECSQCGQSIAVDSAGAGLSTQCPTCDNPLVVPALSSLHDRAYGARTPAGPRTAFADDETEDLREELAEAQRRGDKAEGALGLARKEMAQLQQQIRHAAEDGARWAASAATAQAEVQGQQSELAQSRHRAETVEAQLADARGVIAQLSGQLEALEENRAQWEVAFAETADRTAAAETRLATREAELGAALTAAREEHEALRREGAELRETLENAREERRAAAALAEENLAAARRNLESTEVERQEILGRCGVLRLEAETLRRDLSELHTGRELLVLRERLQTLTNDYERATGALTRATAELQTVTASQESLRADLTDARQRGADAEHRADAASESALKKDNEVLRGIIERQNVVLEERFVELRRLKRARLVLRILYTLTVLALAGLAAFAIDKLPAAVRQWLHDWFGL